MGAKLVGRSSTPQKLELLFPDEQAVRTHMGRLRKSLLAYYKYEAPSEHIQIDIPKRKYIATFSQVVQPPSAPVANQAAPGAPPPVSESEYQSANTLNRRAVRLHSNGQYAEAEPILKRVLAIREQALGLEHPDTATSLNNLAMLYEKQGRYKEAVPILEQALGICERVLGVDHPDTIISVNNLAIGYLEPSPLQGCRATFRDSALAVREEALGTSHPDTATSLNNLAMLYEKQGRYKESMAVSRNLRSRAVLLGYFGVGGPSVHGG